VRARLDIAHDGLRAAVHGALHATGQAVIDAANPELVLTDSAQPEITGARTVRFEGSSGAPDAKPSRSFAGPFVLERTHRLVEGVDLTGAIWAIPEPATPLDPASIPLVLADTMPVVYEDPSGDLRIRIDIEASTVTATPGWPALVWNIVRWRADQRPGLARTNIPLGEPARCIGLESDEPAILVRPDGSRQPVPVADGVATVMSTQLGLHRIEHGEHRWVFSVQPLRLSESDLRSRRTCDLGRWPRATETTGFRSLSWVWAIGAIGVLALHSRMLREWSDAA
jgi:hypothetical protein